MELTVVIFPSIQLLNLFFNVFHLDTFLSDFSELLGKIMGLMIKPDVYVHYLETAGGNPLNSVLK